MRTFHDRDRNTLAKIKASFHVKKNPQIPMKNVQIKRPALLNREILSRDIISPKLHALEHASYATG